MTDLGGVIMDKCFICGLPEPDVYLEAYGWLHVKSCYAEFNRLREIKFAHSSWKDESTVGNYQAGKGINSKRCLCSICEQEMA